MNIKQIQIQIQKNKIPTSQPIQTTNIHASKFEFSKSLCSSIRFHSEWTYLSFRVPKNNNHWISPEKHLADEPIFVNWLGFLLAFPSLWYLSKEPKLRCGTCMVLEMQPKKSSFINDIELTSVHISLTFSNTILQCRSNALTRPRSFLLFLQLISTYLVQRASTWISK